jgi:hypothetical protein
MVLLLLKADLDSRDSLTIDAPAKFAAVGNLPEVPNTL